MRSENMRTLLIYGSMLTLLMCLASCGEPSAAPSTAETEWYGVQAPVAGQSETAVTMGTVRNRPVSEFATDQQGNSVRGYSAGPGYHIQWKGSHQPGGAEPVEVLRALEKRMTYLQGTPAGSDENARALFKVLEALDELQGTKEVSGKPIDP